MLTRRNILTGAALLGAAAVGRSALSAIPEPAYPTGPRTAVPPPPPNGRPFNPVVTLNGWSAPWTVNDGVKEFHLVAEPVVRQIAPGMRANLWGYNGQSPGPPWKRSKATACASSSPTSCRSTPQCTGTAWWCRTAWMASAD